MDRRNMMMMAGFAAAGAAMPLGIANAEPVPAPAPAVPAPVPAVPAPGRGVPPAAAAAPKYLFHDEFDGPAGSSPDQSKWMIATARETIKNPVFWDRPENMGQYRNDRQHVFLDGKSNLVIRATKDAKGKYVSGKVKGTYWGPINTTWEARI